MLLHESTANVLEFYADQHDKTYREKLAAYEERVRHEVVVDSTYISECIYNFDAKTDQHKLVLLNLMSAKTDQEKLAAINNLQKLLKADLDEYVEDLIKDRYFEIMNERLEDPNEYRYS